MIAASRARLRVALDVAILASLTVLPHLLGGRGRLNADTKQYLYLDPGDLLERARNLWDPAVGGGTVTHQAIGYLWPMGPYYWLTDQLGLASWVAQRLWVGGIQLSAALGALALFRLLTDRRPAQLAGAALYGLSPFVLGHVTGQSGLLLPFAAFGWLVWAMVHAVARGGWRWPAVFALVVTSCASLNGSSVFFVVLGATLWVPVAVWSLRTATPRQGVGALLRAGGLTLATQLWWLVAYAVGGANGLPILSVTEQVQTTSYTASGAEVLRGLGYWFFYGADSEGLWLRGLAPPYMERPALIALSFAVPLIALGLGAVVRWGPRTYFAVLVGTGTAIGVGAFPEPARSPVGAAFETLSRRSELVLSLRNTQRAGPLVALGLAGLVVAGLTAIDLRHRRAALAGAGVVGLLVALALPAQWRTGLIAERFHREDVPQAWIDAGAHLDEGTGKVLEVPGIDFASYRWGHTLDPVSVGLTDRPIVARELVPMGGAPGASVLGALDRAVQEGWAEPGMVAAVAELFGASEVLVRSDLEYERYRTVRPARFWELVTDEASPLVLDETFGSREPNRANERRPMLDETQLALDTDAEPPPQLAVFDVPDGGRPAVSAVPVDGAVVVDGDGEGIVQAAAAGLLEDVTGPLLLGADVARDAADLDELAPEGTAFVVTDTNRKRGERWYALRENVGATEPAAHPAVLDDPTDARLEVVPGQPRSAQTTVEWSGAERVWATAYGSALTLVPEERPSNAFDGDTSTAWLLDTFQHRDPHRVGVELDAPLEGADHVVLVPPQGRPGARAVVRARVTLDGRRHFDVEVDEAAARDPDGVRVELDGEPFTRLTVEIRGVLPDDGPAGFAEVRVPGLEVRELVVLPSTVLDALGSRASDAPLALVLSRHRADPSEPVRSDPEPALARAFDLPAPVELDLRGTARLSGRADDGVLASLLGHPDAPRSSESLAGDLRSTAWAAVDGDPDTAWQTPFVGLVGQWIDLPADAGTEITTLQLEVVADGRHSIPTELAVSAGGRTVAVAVPPVESVPQPGAVRRVEVPLPEGIRGDRLRIEITGVDARTTTDWYTADPVALPVGLAEVSADALGPPVDRQPLDTGCRDDLLELDGTPLPVRITGSVEDALDRDPLDVEACGDAPSLDAGRHEVRALTGAATGLDLDRLVLASPGFSTTAAGAAPEVRIGDVGTVSAEATIDSDGSPFWLVLDQSQNPGWELSLDGATVDGPRPIDGYAAGWHVTPDGPGELAASIRWAPQRAVDVALLLSLLAAAVCVALVVLAPGQRRGAAPALELPALGHARPVRRWTAVVAGAVVAGLLVHPLAAAPAAAAVVLARRWPWLGRAVPVLLVAAAAVQVVLFQVRDRHEAAFEWPQHFGGAHVSALLGAVLVAVLAVAEGREERR